MNLKKEYYHTNKKEILKKLSEYRDSNRQCVRERSRIFYTKNKSIFLELNARRKARQMDQTPKMNCLEKSAIKGLYFIAKVLSNSCGESFHVDHIQPISKGGLHCLSNLQILSAEENLRKGAKHA